MEEKRHLTYGIVTLACAEQTGHIVRTLKYPSTYTKNDHAEKRKTNPKAQQSMHVVRYGAEHEPVPE